jgi:hypothetical protein
MGFHFGGRRFLLARCCENRVKNECLRTTMAQECSRGGAGRGSIFADGLSFWRSTISLARCCENRVKNRCLRTAMAQECSRGGQVEAASQKINSGLLPDLLSGCQSQNGKKALPKKHVFSCCFCNCKDNGVAQGGHFSFQAFRSLGKGLPKWSPRVPLENRNPFPRHRFCGPCNPQKYSFLCTPLWF